MAEQSSLENRVSAFGRMELPGQPLGMHMGTSYLVNDLWLEVRILRSAIYKMQMPGNEGKSPGAFLTDAEKVAVRAAVSSNL